MTKKISILTLVLSLVFIVFSCERNNEAAENASIKSNESFLNARVAGEKSEIIHPLFMYGVESYEIQEDGILKFTTYRDFRVNNDSGNINDLKFILDENDVLHLNDDSTIKIENGAIKIVTPDEELIIDDNSFDFQKLNLKTKLLFTVFSDIIATDDSKDTFANYSARFATSGGGCPWYNTYYLSGWGYNPSAAWSDYNYNATHNPLTGCTAIGNPHLSQHTINLGIIEISYYQVDRAYCC
ncbi:hypothetical protein SAMN05421796_1177 [Chryseobacterium piscicola]|uniref:Lipoprotein n=1 Tax=Chryseobacterium piscicola TaxID=551459 RepID=A0A1N7PI79_9FLAO|nr:hypothetical protein [Chryseobacterium piscicola]PQA95521.1 hypothetical protein B0A70_05850 [Chryseobacterium piscicola]SIT10301.1 hypothetical protein SAMN05421796_1177 [Chryseobacterium piscicola]